MCTLFLYYELSLFDPRETPSFSISPIHLQNVPLSHSYSLNLLHLFSFHASFSLSLFLLFQPGSLFSHARIYVFLCSLQGSSHALCHIVRTFGAPLSPCKSVITTRGEAPRRGSSSFSLNGRRATPVGTER